MMTTNHQENTMTNEPLFDTAGIEATILAILGEAYIHKGGRHGYNFINVYTLAARVAERNPTGVAQLPYPLTAGTGSGTSLAQYLASVLVRRIDGGYLPQVEIAWEDTVDAMFR